jgi:hypothetical protein
MVVVAYLSRRESHLAVLGLDDGMLGVDQHATDQPPHGRGVIDDQNQRHRFEAVNLSDSDRYGLYPTLSALIFDEESTTDCR